jgi:anti-sigma28 factor (negative regulator of flagellin synthesis)
MTVLELRYDDLMTDSRPALLEDLQDRIARGLYEVDADAVAGAIVDRLRGGGAGHGAQCS